MLPVDVRVALWLEAHPWAIVALNVTCILVVLKS